MGYETHENPPPAWLITLLLGLALGGVTVGLIMNVELEEAEQRISELELDLKLGELKVKLPTEASGL